MNFWKKGRKTKLGCYCYQQFLDIGFGVNDIVFKKGDKSPEKACQKWLSNYTLNLTVIYGIAMFISFLNAVLRIFLRYVVTFEKKHTVTLQITSAISKMWFVSFFNIAIVVFLINAKYGKLFEPGKNSVIFAGKFSDFKSEWYGEVGAAIGLTTFISSVVPIVNIAFIGISGLKRCWDRSCTCDRLKTKQFV